MPDWRDYIEPAREVAQDLGFRLRRTDFHMVPPERIYRLAAQGLPTAPLHWTRGRDQMRYRHQHETGQGRIYEIVMDLDPVQAFLASSISPAHAVLTVAHVYGHVHVFASNPYQAPRTDIDDLLRVGLARMVEYEALYGTWRLERLIDAALALAPHVSPHRPRVYPPARPKPDPYGLEAAPLPDPHDLVLEERARQHTAAQGIGERDVLWHIATHSPVLEDWEREVLLLEREIALYFSRPASTKIVHEGFASWAHSRILPELDLPPEWALEQARVHAQVLAASFRNPYWLGLMVYRWLEEEGRNPVEEASILSDLALLELAEGDDFLSYLVRVYARAYGTLEREEIDEMRQAIGRWRQAYLEGPPEVMVVHPVLHVAEKGVEARGQEEFPPLALWSPDQLDPEYARRVAEVTQRVWGGTVKIVWG